MGLIGCKGGRAALSCDWLLPEAELLQRGAEDLRELLRGELVLVAMTGEQVETHS